MTQPVIRVENLGKRYILNQQQGGYRTLRETLTERWQKGWFTPQNKYEEFWAVRAVDFTIQPGDRVGVIGRNGAGKSTLLKLLSRITEPTTGRITLRGRVASLLEVGTGFHPELTGRENIFLNGAILGMSKVETARKFDEIVHFAEVEKFLDTPVKRYSSGMYVRLAFAVAAHLEPEVLIVDEVLAVGDMAFQKKCLGKMESVGAEGRTVLFVSHNMAAVRKLCVKGIFMVGGQLALEGTAQACVDQYLQMAETDLSQPYKVKEDVLARSYNSGVSLHKIELLTPQGDPVPLIQTGDGLVIRIHYQAQNPYRGEGLAFAVSLKSTVGQELFRLSTLPISGFSLAALGHQGYVDLWIKQLPVTAGRYSLDLAVARPNVEYITRLEEAVILDIQPQDVYGSGVALDNNQGLIVVEHQWSHHV